MPQTNELLIGAGPDGQPVGQAWRPANRHGLIAGATGTGKTVTLQHLAEPFSDAGAMVFATDIKGNLYGIATSGSPQDKVAERIASIPWLNYQSKAYPTASWDIARKTDHPLCITIGEVGPLLLANLLGLTDSRQAALFTTFQVTDQEDLLLLDLKDLGALLNHPKDNPEILGEDQALLIDASGQALLRRLATLEWQGAEAFFGEPVLRLEDILRPKPDGRGRIHLLDAGRLVHEVPKVYVTLLLWLLVELFERPPEHGDADKPVLALFFGEAHLLFNGTPKALRNRLEQVVRLIHSKGVGVYFVTQSPGGLPDDVLARLGLRIQHSLRAFTAEEQKSLYAVANGFRPNSAFDILGVLIKLDIDEALIGTLEEKGTPTMVQHVAVTPPYSRIGPSSDSKRAKLVQRSPLKRCYDQPIDCESVYEVLTSKADAKPEIQGQTPTQQESTSGVGGTAGQILGSLLSNLTVRNTMRQVANQLSRELMRGLLGSLMDGKKRR